MRYACPECVPEHSRDNLAILEPRLCGSSPGRTFLLLRLKVGSIGCHKRSLSWSKRWARHRNKYKRAHGAATDELADTWAHRDGGLSCPRYSPSVTLYPAALLIPMWRSVRSYRAEKGPGRADRHRRNHEISRILRVLDWRRVAPNFPRLPTVFHMLFPRCGSTGLFGQIVGGGELSR